MAIAQTSPVIRYIRRLAVLGDAELPDSALLGRFVRCRDEDAFAALVRRHGPMVFGVCRRVLGNWHKAEDCFQMVFVVLARKADALTARPALAPWLHTVAVRTSLKLRSREARRDRQEKKSAASAAVEDRDDLAWRDLRPVLDEAVDHLPEKYRAAFVLCCLEEKTIAEAARQLRCPPGTVATHLARARQRLRLRLSRRGVTLGAGLAVPMLAVSAARAESTVQAAMLAAKHAAERGSLSALAAAWSEGARTVMHVSKMKIGIIAFSVLALFGAGIGTFTYRAATPGEPSRDRKGAVAPSRDRKGAVAPALPRIENVRWLSLKEARAIAMQHGKLGERGKFHPGRGTVGISVPPSDAEVLRIHQTLLDIESAYWSLYGSYWHLYSRERAMRLAYETWKLAQVKRSENNATPSDLAQAKGQYDLFRSHRVQTLDQLREEEQKLRELLGMAKEDGKRLAPSDEPNAKEEMRDWEAAWKQALAKRTELKQARQELQTAKENKKDNKELARLQLILQDRELKIERQLGMYFRRLSSAHTQYKAARAQRDAFAAQLRLRSEAYRAGKPDGALDLLLESQRFWADALATEHIAIASYNGAIAGWDYARGSIGDRLTPEQTEEPGFRWSQDSGLDSGTVIVFDSEELPLSLPALWSIHPPSLPAPTDIKPVFNFWMGFTR